MVGVDKKKLGDILKKAEEKKNDVTKATAPTSKSYSPTSGIVSKKAGTTASVKAAGDELKALREQRKAAELEAKKKLRLEIIAKQKEVLHSKTHQDLINAAYKAAEELKIAPWELLRAAKWGHFTEDRGKKYDGPALNEIDTLSKEQRVALKKQLGLLRKDLMGEDE